jgi:integrase
LFRDTKTECKEAALEYLKAEEAAIKSLRKKTLGDCHRQIQKLWDDKVKNKATHPKAPGGMTQSSKDRLEQNVKKLFQILPYGGQTDLSIIDKEWYSNFYYNLKDNHSSSIALRVRNILNNLLQTGEQMDWIISPHNAFKDTHKIIYKSVGKEAITSEQGKKLFKELEYSFNYGHLSNSHGHYGHNSGHVPMVCESAFLMMVQYCTGCRWGEAAALTVEDFDWNKLELLISKSKNYRRKEISLTKAGHLRRKGTRRNLVDTKVFRRLIVSKWKDMGVDPKTISLRIGHSVEDTKTQDVYGTYSDPNAKSDVKNLEKELFDTRTDALGKVYLKKDLEVGRKVV